MAKPVTPEELLRRAVKRAIKPWVEAWAHFPDHPLLVASLLKGVEFRLAQKRGEVSEAQRIVGSGSYDHTAFWEGKRCAESIPEAIYSLRPRVPGSKAA